MIPPPQLAVVVDTEEEFDWTAPFSRDARTTRSIPAQALAHGIAARLGTQARTRTEPSLYDGLAGDATALRMLEPGSEGVALRRLAELATPEGWETRVLAERGIITPFTDVIGGSAGIVMAAVWAGGEHAGSIATTGGEALRRRRAARPPERTRRPETDVVEQDDQDVGSALWGQQRLDRRERGVGVLGVIRRQTRGRPVRDGQHGAGVAIW